MCRTRTNGLVGPFHFLDGILVGYYFHSSFPEDSTNFDISQFGNIVEGESTEQEVVAVLGKPAGEEIYPFIDDREGRVLWYRYLDSNIHSKADIELDRNGLVQFFRVNVETSE